MTFFKSTICLHGKPTEVTVQRMDFARDDGIEYFLIHSKAVLIAIVSVDGACNFEVIEGSYEMEELKPVCNKIKEFKESAGN